MNESYREVLPFLEPRTGDMGWLAAAGGGIVLAIVVGAVASYVYAAWRARVRARRAFYAAGLERRLSKAQIRLLLDLSREQRLRAPLLLLTSLKAFDRCAGAFAARFPPTADDRRLRMLAAIRQRLGFDAPPVEQRFYTTRTLAPGQMLALWPQGSDEGFLRVVVARRDERAIHAAPLLREDDRRLSQLDEGDRVKVRFWRKGDTEYRFRTDVLETDARRTTVCLRHAEQLERVQLRDYFRVRTNMDVTLFAVDSSDPVADEDLAAAAVARVDAGIRDVSGGGLGVTAGEPVPPRTEVVVDPDFAGPFPIAGARCLVGTQQQHGDSWRIRLQFSDLPPHVRDDLVAAVFAHEVRVAGP